MRDTAADEGSLPRCLPRPAVVRLQAIATDAVVGASLRRSAVRALTSDLSESKIQRLLVALDPSEVSCIKAP